MRAVLLSIFFVLIAISVCLFSYGLLRIALQSRKDRSIDRPSRAHDYMAGIGTPAYLPYYKICAVGWLTGMIAVGLVGIGHWAGIPE